MCHTFWLKTFMAAQRTATISLRSRHLEVISARKNRKTCLKKKIHTKTTSSVLTPCTWIGSLPVRTEHQEIKQFEIIAKEFKIGKWLTLIEVTSFLNSPDSLIAFWRTSRFVCVTFCVSFNYYLSLETLQ